jgi:hypothetical protein
VYFNEKFIEILIHKLERLKDFKFMYLNAGIDIDFKLPWVIHPEWGCDFDLLKIAKIPTSTKKLKKRRKAGIECPFFESNIDQHISKTIMGKRKASKVFGKRKPKR